VVDVAQLLEPEQLAGMVGVAETGSWSSDRSATATGGGRRNRCDSRQWEARLCLWMFGLLVGNHRSFPQSWARSAAECIAFSGARRYSCGGFQRRAFLSVTAVTPRNRPHMAGLLAPPIAPGRRAGRLVFCRQRLKAGLRAIVGGPRGRESGRRDRGPESTASESRKGWDRRGIRV